MLANGCFVTDANHRFDDPGKTIRGKASDEGPEHIGDNAWLCAHSSSRAA